VRYYLNGLLVEIKPEGLRAVATDGHRLALYEKKMTIDSNVDKQVLIPRKAVVELGRLLKYCDGDVRISVSPNSVRFNVGQVAFKSKLIDGRFPDYDRVIPKDVTKSTILDKDAFRQSLTRAAIMSKEKYRGFVFYSRLIPCKYKRIILSKSKRRRSCWLSIKMSH
jgi:DNA polymerase-3 subunit beta